MLCQPRSPSPTSESLETGIQTIQSSPCTPCLLVNHRTAAPRFDPFPDMLWPRSPFGVSAGSSPAPVSRSGTSYASTLSSYENSFFFAPPRRPHKGYISSCEGCPMTHLSPLPEGRDYTR